MKASRDKPGARRTARRIVRWWIASAAAAILLVLIPTRTPAQDDGMGPSPMATPEILMMPSVALYPYPAYGVAPLVVGFIPQIHDPAGSLIVSYKWNFGDGQISTTPPMLTSVTYTKPGVYVASLTISTADGRSATGFASVTVKAPGN